MSSGTVYRNDVGHLGRLLAASRARLFMVSVRIPSGKHLVFRQYLHNLMARQKAIEKDLIRVTGGSLDGTLGWIVPVAIVGGSILSLVGAKVFQQHRETKEVESRMEIYDKLIGAGYTAEDAGRLAFGDEGSGIGGVLNKLIVLTAIGAGVLVFLKWRPK